MFYCEECAEVKGWPIGFFKLRGKCEMCGKRAICSNISSTQLHAVGKRNEIRVALEKELLRKKEKAQDQKTYETIRDIYDASLENYKNKFKDDEKLMGFLRNKFLANLKKELNLL